MASEEDEQNPWTRPGFVAATILITVIVLLGVALVVVNVSGRTSSAATPSPRPPASPTTTPSGTPTPINPSPSASTTPTKSICGLADKSGADPLSTGPAADWRYDGTTAYPTSSRIGPGLDQGGVRTCFQHSTEGALFAAANAVAEATASQDVRNRWINYFVAEGPYRQTIIADATKPTAESSGVRINISGFRVLEYTGDTARIDIGVQGSVETTALTMSFVYDLVWRDGDWKLSAQTDEPFSSTAVPNLEGYVTWGER